MENQPASPITGIESLDTNPMFLMGLAYKQFRSQIATGMGATSSISLEMYGALNVLSEHDKITQQELTNYLLRNRSVTKRLVDNAIKLGLVVASKSETNKKIKLLSLTKEGKELTTQCAPVVDSISQQFQSSLSEDETQQLQQLLAKLVKTDQLVD
ncbi:MarR family winged helix-turn-helix transcriptional regulator [Photobacterium satsumensis]|uniref:MarR family winged helix-turn-helix transcriptional regulator n=1 Tax=Photobacterium satsumensis TaxID=2910239 RepID=UPI003D11D2D4